MLAYSRAVSRPFLLAAFALAGCGARSGLLEGSGGTTSSTASGSTTTTASTTATTSTGAPKKVCYGLVSSGPPIMTTDADQMNLPTNERRPFLVQAEAGNVAVLVGEDIPLGPTNAGSLRAAGFQPWGQWPNDLGSTFSIASSVGPTFTAAHAYGDGKAGYEAFFVAENVGSPPLLYLSGELHTGQNYAPLPPGTQIPGGPTAMPMFFVATASGRIEANDASIAGGNHLAVVHAPDMPPPSLPGDSILACGNTPIAGAGIPEGTNPAVGGPYALVAVSNTRAELGCAGLAGPATKVIVDTWPSSGPPSPKTSIDNATPVRQIELVPRNDGAWLVWQSDKAAGGGSDPAVMATRVDALGKTIANTFEAIPAGANGYPFAASAIGDELVVAYVESTDPLAKTSLRLRVFLPDGTPDGDGSVSVASLTVPPGGPWWVDPQRISLLGDQDSVILAWSEHVTEPTAPGRVLVTRFTCAGPE